MNTGRLTMSIDTDTQWCCAPVGDVPRRRHEA